MPPPPAPAPGDGAWTTTVGLMSAQPGNASVAAGPWGPSASGSVANGSMKGAFWPLPAGGESGSISIDSKDFGVSRGYGRLRAGRVRYVGAFVPITVSLRPSYGSFLGFFLLLLAALFPAAWGLAVGLAAASLPPARRRPRPPRRHRRPARGCPA